MADINKARSLLATGRYTCVLCRGESVFCSTDRGVKPLVAWYESKTDFSGFSAADKVVGRGAAFLYLLLGVTAVYAEVISTPAKELLSAHGVELSYGREAEYIINRKGDGMCPFEAAVLDVSDKTEAYAAIRRKMIDMNIEI
ncbi:MAG: DUF1893 domain-containing protein [Clostridia bacterium]|nr:DUF1893 domain-containing protein [Clostridia bacterium]MBR3593404.1 DUF1893 domain-containing protein [Clostridia bacterium]